MTSQSHIVGAPLQNGGAPFLSADPATMPYGQTASAEPRSNNNAPNTYPAQTNPTARDTALKDYSSSSSTSSSAYAPNGYISSREGQQPMQPNNGYARYPNHAPPPPPGRSTTLPPLTTNGHAINGGPNNSPPRARMHLNASLNPSLSPTSRTFGRRADSPPASSYFAASPSSQHRMTPTAGHDARDLGDHFSFSTTLRRHTLPPTEEILPFSAGGSGAGSGGGFGYGSSGGGGGGNDTFGAVEERVRELVRPLAHRFGLEKLLFPRREDEELNGTEYGYGMNERVTLPIPAQDRSIARDTVSAQYAPMPAQVSTSSFSLFWSCKESASANNQPLLSCL